MIPPELEAEIDDCCDRYEALWRAGDAPRLPDFLAAASAAARPHLLWELVALERYYRRDQRGDPLSITDLAVIHPALADQLAVGQSPRDASTAAPHVESDVVLASDSQTATPHGSRGLHVRCPHCSNPMEIVADSPYEDVTCRTCGSTFNLVDRDSATEHATTLRQLGRFELVSRLGVGGFGTVWKARDSELDRLVAIKIPRKGQLTPTDVEQFFREARAAAQLYHPNIVSVYEVGRADDTVFIVSDFVRGVPLSDYLTGHQPSATEIAHLGVAIAEALQHAHEHGVIHRDLKPSNIMINENDTPLIMDFGLAKRDLGEITMTVDGQILGTPGYMSPEQARGQSHWTDRRSDVYSLGTVLFRMATGELPFRGNARMQLHQKLTDDPPDPHRLNATIPRDLSTICLKCIQRDPNHRYPTAREVGRELQRFLAGEPIRARPLSRTARVYRWARRKPALASAVVFGCGLAIAGPLAAWQQATIAEQRRVRLAERDQLVSEQKIKLDDKSATIAGLKQELSALQGGESGITTKLDGWRLGLIEDLVTARQATMNAVLTNDDSVARESIYAGLGLGILQAQIGRDDEALQTLQATEQRLVELTKQNPDDTQSIDLQLIDAHADCWQRIANLHQRTGNHSATIVAYENAIELRKQLADHEPTTAAQQLRLMELAVQKATSDTTSKRAPLNTLRATDALQQIEKRWPTDAREFYRLACQLTKSDVVLGGD